MFLMPPPIVDMILIECWAGQRELWCPVVVESTPMSLIAFLSIVGLALFLVFLIKGLKVEDIHSHGKHGAHTSLEEGFRVLGAGDSYGPFL